MCAVVHAGAAGLPSQSNVPDVQMHVDGFGPKFFPIQVCMAVCVK